MDFDPKALSINAVDTVDEGGLDPDQVRALFEQATERIRELERKGVRGVGESVSAVLDQATRSGEELIEHARADADRIREVATADAEHITAEAAEVAAHQIAEGESAAAKAVEEAESRAATLVGDAEAEARERATTVINDAQQRLDRLLAAERNVHDRLKAAMNDIKESVAKVGVDQTPELMLTVADPDAPLDELHWRDDADGTDAGDGSDDAGERRSA